MEAQFDFMCVGGGGKLWWWYLNEVLNCGDLFIHYKFFVTPTLESNGVSQTLPTPEKKQGEKETFQNSQNSHIIQFFWKFCFEISVLKQQNLRSPPGFENLRSPSGFENLRSPSGFENLKCFETQFNSYGLILFI